MRYTFQCRSSRHPEDAPRTFETFIHIAQGKRVDQTKCPECGGLAKRDFVADFKTVAITGGTPISLSTTGKGSMYETVKFAFGRHKQNPDGSVDTNHAPFRDSKELERYVNGKNDLGPAKTDDKGNVLRRPDGSVIHEGAKLVKFDRHKAPPVNKKPRYDVPDAWVGSDVVEKSGAVKGVPLRAPKYRSPQRSK